MRESPRSRTKTPAGATAIPDYSIYGLTLRADRALRGLHAAPAGVRPDVVVHLQSVPPWAAGVTPAPPAVHGSLDEAEGPIVELAAYDPTGRARIRYPADDTQFFIEPSGHEIWATWSPPMTLDDAMVYLLGPVLGLVLRRRGVLALHASAIVIDGRAIAFCGPRGTGKSTTAAAFAAAGFAALADDVLALRPSGGDLIAFSAYDHLRVWDDSARILVGDRERLPLLTPNWEKRAFAPEAHGHAVERAPIPLGAVFLLQARSDDEGAPRVEAVTAADAFIALTACTTANYLLDLPSRREEFAPLAALVDRTPVYRLVPHADPARVPQLIARVLDTVRGG